MSIRSKVPTKEYQDGYDQIDWSKGPAAREDGNYGGEHVEPVKTISAIRSDKPHVSESAAIHAEQVHRFNKEAARGTHYNAKGQLVSESWAARKRELKRRGMSDGYT